jgi:ribosomal protein L18
MPSFGVIGEGPTDFVVLKNILEGFFKGHEGDTVVNPVQPKASTDPGGWTLVMRALREQEVRKALQFNDWVVVQVDTEVCEEVGFDVARSVDGKPRSVEELVNAVRSRLLTEMGGDEEAAARTIFAVAVNELECWLLPLLFDRSEASSSAKIAGCLKAANDKLAARREPRLSQSDGTKKDPRAYKQASAAFRKRKALNEAGERNESLGLFVAELERREAAGAFGG